MDDRTPGDLGQYGGDVPVTQRLRPGDDQIGVRGAAVEEGAYGDGGDVLRVDEPDPPLTGGRADDPVGADGPGVEVVTGEVLHEPGGPQDRPLVEDSRQRGMHLPHGGPPAGIADELSNTARRTPEARARRRNGSMTAAGSEVPGGGMR
ncbi:hypothetical protein Smic_44290 [Streptomyces microflavus]|uniref:Uncharacterized protein n=1 Tax=Streptomyces microflavus TaxID=1919 RepID=A0A7J0CTT2_STRMI|nr:hypothetical protein Smic_44290 [Streptomyces microflavus]